MRSVRVYFFLVLVMCLQLVCTAFAESVPSTLSVDLWGLPTCEEQRELCYTIPFMVGEDVREVQVRLNELGLFDGPIDGVFGIQTELSVRRFQSVRGLPETGIVDQGTWDLLWAEEAQGQQDVPPPGRPKGPVRLEVDVRRLRLTVYDGDKVFKTYPVAIGKFSTPTPVGEFTIVNKRYNPGGPFGARWMGLNIPWGTYGVHGTNRPSSIGSHASAGCIRMFNHHVIELFEWVPVGTRITIIGREIRATVSRILRRGHVGVDVQYVQYKIRQVGFDGGPLDGRFGAQLEQAIREMQAYYGIRPTGVVDLDELLLLGIK
ncbi:MAG: peptidoglycan-binding protein [Bacillota bacterium]